ncbi:MAG: nucleoside hydrolase [Alkalispirochaetaceae bacterium]
MIDIFLDCDNTFGNPQAEIDDGLLILYLLGEPRVRLRGISLTFGNGPIDSVTDATESLLKLLGRKEIPVYRGAAEAGEWETPAARGIVETLTAEPETRLLATGPLTNLAAAEKLHPGILAQAPAIALMGGVEAPLHYPKREGRELNFSADPESALKVLTASDRVCLFPAETCMQLLFGYRSLLTTLGWPSWARRTTWAWFRRFSSRYGTGGFYLWDLLPGIWLLEPELFAGERVRFLEPREHPGSPGLEEGRLNVTPAGASGALMVRRISDPDRVMDLLKTGWRQALREASSRG